MASPTDPRNLFWAPKVAGTCKDVDGPGEEEQQVEEVEDCELSGKELSLFERIVSAHPPVLESLLSQLPTSSVLALFHTSRYFRSFLADYPLAWKSLSFRLPQPAIFSISSPGVETPDGRERQSKAYALDTLLIEVVVPFATRLKNLDLCNTAISGVALVSQVLQPRIDTIQHLSVRGCKNVSIKYHIVPFLQLHSQHHSPWVKKNKLALKSLYTYRCRHHRRRPYLPSSLIRRDSDSEPTHDLIEICHLLNIWTDTAWCPTPGGRCFRRKDYHSSRTAPGTPEVWVPFDRLWRSGNRIGPSEEDSKRVENGVRLWEDMESGHDGEALGTEEGSSMGEGKDLPAHLRKSHRAFVEEIRCDQCGDAIQERCEQCSLRMHCMGCRKTLCASCVFNKPLPRKPKRRNLASLLGLTGSMNSAANDSDTASVTSQASSSHGNSNRRRDRFWWAPGATRSPNLMNELEMDDDSSDSDDLMTTAHPGHAPFNSSLLKLQMQWCCLEPIFSGGGGIAFLGPGLGGKGADKIRAAPLPKNKDYEDPDFKPHQSITSPDALSDIKGEKLYEQVFRETVDVLQYLKADSIDLQANTCPRSLCQDCYHKAGWRVSCRACNKPLCKEHDFRGLKVRKCGYRDLNVEREYVRSHPSPSGLEIPAFRQPQSPSQSRALSPMPSEAFSRSSSALSSQPQSQASSSSGQATVDLDYTHSPSSTLVSTEMTASVSNLSSISTVTNLASAFGPISPRPRSLSESGPHLRPSYAMWSTTPIPAIEQQQPQQQRVSSRPLPPAPLLQSIRSPLPLHPLHPVQWEGCGAFFCQQYRPVGDGRPRCQAQLRECGGCGVLVCQSCLQKEGALCTCAYCTAHYHCPHCVRKPAVASRCRAKEEEAARRQREIDALRRKEEEQREARRADEVAESVGAFFGALRSVPGSPRLLGMEKGKGTVGTVGEGRRREPEDVPLPKVSCWEGRFLAGVVVGKGKMVAGRWSLGSEMGSSSSVGGVALPAWSSGEVTGLESAQEEHGVTELDTGVVPVLESEEDADGEGEGVDLSYYHAN